MKHFRKRLSRLMKYLKENVTGDQGILSDCRLFIKQLYDKYRNEPISDGDFAYAIYKVLVHCRKLNITFDEVWEAWMDIIYESEELLVKSTGHDYDFIATLEINNSEFSRKDEDLVVVFEDEYKDLDAIQIPQDDWVGLLADEEGYRTIKAIRKHKFYTIWANYYEEENNLA